jgi:hypothetical protein
MKPVVSVQGEGKRCFILLHRVVGRQTKLQQRLGKFSRLGN